MSSATMARRESRASRVYNTEMEELRRQMKAEMKEMEEKLRTAAKIMVLKERESWQRDRETLQRQLSVTEEENRKLKADLHKAKEEIGQREVEINSLHHNLSALEENYDAAIVAWWKELNKEREKAEEEIKKRDEEIICLQQSLHAQREESERVRASVDEWKEASGVKSMEEKWQRKVGQLEELLTVKEKLIVRANEKRQACTHAHVDTLAQLSEAQSALKHSKLTCDALEDKLQKQLAEKEESHRKELTQREESFHNELSHQLKQSKKELTKLCESWEMRAQQWDREKRELDEMLQVKEKIWTCEDAERKEDIQHLKREIIRLQELTKEKKKKKSFWSWSL